MEPPSGNPRQGDPLAGLEDAGLVELGVGLIQPRVDGLAERRGPYRTSPFGKAVHPWLNKADTKFNEAGVFKTGQRVP
jgi:hypothetical protein